MPKGEAVPAWPTSGQSDWRTASELLAAGQYERVAQLLSEAQVASERGGEVVPAQMLAAARGICLACSQVHTEGEWHRQAEQEAGQREGELRQQLLAILDLVNGHAAPDVPPFVRRSSLKQRIRELLGRGSIPGLTRRETPESHIRPPLLSAERAEKLAAVPKTRPATRLHSLVVHCLGAFRVYQDDRLVEKWPGNKCKSIFKYMIIHREQPVHQEILMELFWPDVDPDAARRNLYQAVYHLRQALQNGDTGFTHIVCEDGCYYLSPDLEIWVDSEAFCLHHQTGGRLEREGNLHEAIQAYEQADNLYQGEFLAEDRYEDWTVVHRENLKHTHLDILDRLSQYNFDQAQYAACIAYCQRILVEDSCREDAHRRLMRCYLRQGQRHLALRQYHLCVEALERELDVPPMPATLELFQQILANRV